MVAEAVVVAEAGGGSCGHRGSGGGRGGVAVDAEAVVVVEAVWRWSQRQWSW